MDNKEPDSIYSIFGINYFCPSPDTAEMTGQGRGGRREGSGRPKAAVKRKRRALDFFDGEWELIRKKAAAKNRSPRAYLYWLVEHDV